MNAECYENHGPDKYCMDCVEERFSRLRRRIRRMEDWVKENAEHTKRCDFINKHRPPNKDWVCECGLYTLLIDSGLMPDKAAPTPPKRREESEA